MSSSLSDLEDEPWLDIEPDEESPPIISLLDQESFSTLSEMLDHCKLHHRFDFAAVIRDLQLDFHGVVRLVNFIRTCTREHRNLPEKITVEHFSDDLFLQPVFENDPLILSLCELLDGIETESKGNTTSSSIGSNEDLSARNRDLASELQSLRSHFADYRLAVEETLDRRWGNVPEYTQTFSEDTTNEKADYYFDSYAANDIHETMLKDTVRTDAYRNFIYDNKHIFKNKVVLDIGCGTGILSMFCAHAGAAQVLAVDNSDIIAKATENIFNNGLSGIIICLKGAIEEVKLPVDQVDIIVSEWMGYCLLYEAMLPSVLYARDKYLKPDGLLVPSSATMWIAPVEDSKYVSDNISFWKDVYGFDMSAMQEGILDDVRIEAMPQTSLCGQPYPFKILNLYTVQSQDLQFMATWESSLTRNINGLNGFLIWFDIFFAVARLNAMPEPSTTPEIFNQARTGSVAFTTGPSGTMTHWKQGLLLLPVPTATKQLETPCSILGKVTFAALGENARALKIDMSWHFKGDGEAGSSWKLC